MTVRRQDWAVVLARGDSSRMGRPKGTCRVPGGRETFLSRICELHRRAAHEVAVVTLPELGPTYEACVHPATVTEWILHPPGGGTAASCLAAVHRLADRATHLWFHPVDLPLVSSATIRHLAAVSAAAADELLIPRHEGLRGHPVVSPLRPWLGMRPDDHPGAMRSLIEQCGSPVRFVDLPDSGIRLDFDRPEDLTDPT